MYCKPISILSTINTNYNLIGTFCIVNIVREEKSVGNWESGTIDYRNVTKKYYVVGNTEKGYFWFYHAKSEWVVDGYFDIKRVQRKSEQVTETRVWYE